jgi:hypothetical protein
MDGASAAQPCDCLTAQAHGPHIGSPPNHRGLIFSHEFHGKLRVAHGALARDD